MLLQIPQCSLPSVAECFLRAGFSIIPVKPDTKEPAVRWKPYMNQLMNVELVDEFFHRNSNIAIVTGEASKLTVFDIDDIEKFNQFYDFEQLKNEAGTIVKTPRGYHLYFTYEPDLKTKQHQDFGFDIKNEGALVTAPPSTVNGHVYFFEKANGLGEIPKDLKEKITSLQRAKNDCFDEILSKLRVVRQLPDGTYRCFCPAHDDQEPSLDVGLKNNRLYIHCWAGCSKKEVLEAIGFEQKETKEERDNTAKKLLQLVENFQLWTNQNGEEFISLPEGNLRIESKEFKKYLQLLFYQKYGKPAHTQAVLEAVSTLSGKAIFEGEKQKSFIRVGKIENFIELDLCNGYAVRIDRENIRVSKPYCKFERPASLLPLPIPDLNIEGDEWKFLKHFINTNNDGVVLILGWLVGCFNLDGEFPILNIVGEREGVGKTTASKFLKSIIDPAVVLTKPLPKTEDDLLAVCLHNHIVAFDNISALSDSISDALCRISTGSGLAKRRLFTDADAVLYFVKNPVILNGIDFFAERRDLRRRCLHIELQRLTQPKPADKLESEFRYYHSKLLGWLCKAVQLALREEINEDMDLTDMASFVSFVCKAERIFPIPAKDFVESFKQNRFCVSIATIAENPIVSFLLELTENGDWTGTVSELHEIMTQKFQSSHIRNQLPKDAKSLSRKIRRMLTDLENIGITCSFFRDSKNLSNIHIKKIEKNISETPIIPKALQINGLQDGDILEIFGNNLNISILSPEQEALINNVFGDTGVTETKNQTFLMDDVVNDSDINPDDIEVLEDDYEV